MYVPGRAPSDLYTREGRRGLSLYAKNVFIMEDCRELMPEHLRFIRGLVDELGYLPERESGNGSAGPNHCIHAKGAHEEMVEAVR